MSKIYRKGVFAIIINQENKFLLVQLNAYGDNEWNFVGGGREGDETSEENLYREIKEELGLDLTQFIMIGKSSHVYQYDFPEPILKDDGVTYDGQIKEQFVVRFIGKDSGIKIQEDEIRKYKWISVKDLQSHLVFNNQYERAMLVIQELMPELL